MIKNKKLIIWDFDGVIAKTEHLWVSAWNNILNKNFNLGWDFETAYKNLAGISPTTKIERLRKNGIELDEKSLKEILKKEIEFMSEIELTKNITDILKNNKIKHCVATGGPIEKTFKKIKIVGLEKYFTKENVFNAEMVSKGKPDPELFLYAMNKMGYKIEDCVIVEDSKAGVEAAIRSGIDLIVFIEHQLIEKKEFVTWAKKQGAINFANDVSELKKFFK